MMRGAIARICASRNGVHAAKAYAHPGLQRASALGKRELQYRAVAAMAHLMDHSRFVPDEVVDLHDLDLAVHPDGARRQDLRPHDAHEQR